MRRTNSGPQIWTAANEGRPWSLYTRPVAREDLFVGENLPAGAALIEEGLALGAQTAVGSSAFCRDRGVRSEVEWKRSRMAAGEIEWSAIMGLASLEEQVAGLERLHAFGQETGVVIDRALCIPNWVTGLPDRLRERAPASTSFVLGGLEDHVAVAEAAPIMPCFNDFHIGSPAAVPNTRAAIESGGTYTGVLSQYVWDLPYFESDVESVAENIKAIALVAEKWTDEVVVDSYLDDGMCAEFVDNVSLIGYARLERYIVENLCGARYATGFGQLLTDIPTKIAVWLALAEVLKADHPALSYLYGNTIDASDSLLTGNYGIASSEYMIFAATERRYRTGVALLPNPITEKVRVPTVEEIADIHAASHVAAGKALELEDLLDFSNVEEMRDVLVREGTQFFENVLGGLPEFGIDVRDPMQVMLGIRRIGAQRLENLYHPLERDNDQPNGIAAVSPTEFTMRATEMIDSETAAIRDRGLADAVTGRCFVVASADTHFYGKFVLTGVLRELGAEVIDAGVGRNPEDLAALLDGRPETTSLAVSLHNGQCLAYSERLMGIMLAAGRHTDVFVGGRLNAIFPGESEPRDAVAELREIGVIPCTTVSDLAEKLARAKVG